MTTTYSVHGRQIDLLLQRINVLILKQSFGERGGTRTLDPMIKSHVLYRLSYALTCRAV